MTVVDCRSATFGTVAVTVGGAELSGALSFAAFWAAQLSVVARLSLDDAFTVFALKLSLRCVLPEQFTGKSRSGKPRCWSVARERARTRTTKDNCGRELYRDPTLPAQAVVRITSSGMSLHHNRCDCR